MNPQHSPDQHPSALPPLPVVIWQDIFVVVDHGALHASRYAEIEQVGRDLIARHGAGIAVLVIIPSVAKPPPEEVRTAITNMLARVAPSLRCVCWLVEGSGFGAAAVRAALTGLQLVSRSPYPTRVCSSVGEALSWILPHMRDGNTRLGTVSDAVQAIAEGRKTLSPGPSAS
jgi:hypothetical protein